MTGGSEPTVLILGRQSPKTTEKSVQWRSEEGTAATQLANGMPDGGGHEARKRTVGGGSEEEEEDLVPEAFPVVDELSVFYCKEGCFR